MGVFNWPVRLDSTDAERSLQLDALVELADGRTNLYDIGEARATIGERSATTWVIFGEDDARPLLGAYTLEGLLLTVDPRKLAVVPAPYFLR